MSGIIIEFEGLDGSYKETNALRAYEAYKNILGEDSVSYYSFPKYDSESSFFVREFLKGNYGKDMPVDIINKFYALDMYDSWEKSMKQDFEKHKFIICDRYMYSNAICQTARLKGTYIENQFKYIFRSNIMEQLDLRLPEPNLIIYMRQSINNSISALKNKKDRDINENDTDFLTNCYEVCEKAFCTDAYFVDTKTKVAVVNTYDTITGEPLPANDIFRNVIEAMHSSIQNL